MKLSIKKRIAECRRKLEVAETSNQRVVLENEIRALEDCLNNRHVFTETHTKENNTWKIRSFCHYCGQENV